MARIIVLLLTVTVNLTFQSTVFGYIAIIGIKPNSAILIIISYAILRGDSEGALAGFAAGLLQDCFFGEIIGMNAMLYMIIGYMCGKPFKDFFHENIFFPLLLSLISVLFYGHVIYFTNFLLRGRLDYFYYFRKIILPETVYTVALAMPVYRLVYGLNDRLEKHERSRRLLFKEK